MSIGLRWLPIFCALLGLAPAPIAATDGSGYGFSILRAELKPDMPSGEYRLDADIDYRFSEPAIDALRNGVSLTLALRIRVKRESAWWWGATVADETRLVRIRYHALSKLFQIVEEDRENPRNFVSINALLEALGAVRDLPILPVKRLRPGDRYRASLAVKLDIESLPLPLRPVAYLTPAWYLSSPLYKWTFVN